MSLPQLPDNLFIVMFRRSLVWYSPLYLLLTLNRSGIVVQARLVEYWLTIFKWDFACYSAGETYNYNNFSLFQLQTLQRLINSEPSLSLLCTLIMLIERPSILLFFFLFFDEIHSPSLSFYVTSPMHNSFVSLASSCPHKNKWYINWA